MSLQAVFAVGTHDVYKGCADEAMGSKRAPLPSGFTRLCRESVVGMYWYQTSCSMLLAKLKEYLNVRKVSN